jgi:hypothetical protein
VSRLFVLLTLLFVGISTMFGQQLLPDPLDPPSGLPAHVLSTHVVGRLAAGVIDGSQNPQQIPDSTAYRLVLINVSEGPNPTEEQKARQLAFLRASGLDNNDIEAALPVLAKFKSEYSDLISRYNESVAASNASGRSPNVTAFLYQRDTLVQSTRDALGVALSADGMTSLHAHVQHEKTKMKVVAKEGQ